jgi:hypothetical protein
MILCADSEVLHLEVRGSLVPGAGEGLFAKSEFEVGDIIGEYRGRVISSEDCYHPAFLFEDKMVYMSSAYSLLGESLAAKANDIVLYQPDKVGSLEWAAWLERKEFPVHPGLVRNAKIQYFPKDKMMLVCTRPIAPGQ